jgi:hypothetical protein
VAAHGLLIDPPAGWDVRIYRRAGDDPATRRPDVSPEGTSNPVLHLSTVVLPDDRGDYGSTVVERLGDLDAFVALVEFDAEAAGTALFRTSPVPRAIEPSDLQAHTLQRVITGQAGLQYFAQEQQRAFCLYVVAGSGGQRNVIAQRVSAALASLEIAPRNATAGVGGSAEVA